MTNVRVKLVETHHEMEACVALRLRVFVDEQGVPPDEELDEYDNSADHAVALLGGRVVGTGRLYLLASAVAQIGRMAVESTQRRNGIGSLILSFLEERVRLRGNATVVVHAQTYVKFFYERHDYVAAGEPFMEAGIEHLRMIKYLNEPSQDDSSSGGNGRSLAR